MVVGMIMIPRLSGFLYYMTVLGWIHIEATCPLFVHIQLI